MMVTSTGPGMVSVTASLALKTVTDAKEEVGRREDGTDTICGPILTVPAHHHLAH